MTLGTPRVHRRTTGSTSADARALALAGAPHGTLVSALEQRDGRGRQGRRWVAPAGQALLCSLVLRDPPALLPLAAAVAVAEIVGDAAMLKWPNDVLLGGRKIAGILIEGRPQEDWAVLGIGLNVAVRLAELPGELAQHAGTLGLEPGDVEPILARLLAALERWLDTDDGAVIDAWSARDALRGARIAWNPPRAPGAGRAAEAGTTTGVGLGIDGRGRLRVRLDDGREETLDAGEVHLVTPAG